MIGHIKLEKKILGWEWYKDHAVKSVFLHLLLTANYKDSKYDGKVIKRGQVVTGRCSLSEQLNLTEQNVRTALNKLKNTKEISISSTKQYSVITICKYDDYQSIKSLSNQRPTNDLTNNLTNELTNELTNGKHAEVVDKEPFVVVSEKILTNELTNELTNGLTNKLTTSIEVQEVKEEYINNKQEVVLDVKKNNNINQEAAASRTQRSDFISLSDGKVIFDYDSLIPESRLTGVMKYLKTIHGFDVSKERVLDFWNIFRDLQIDAGKGYDRPEDGYTHFFNWAAGRPLPKEKRAYAASVSKSVNGNKKKEDVVGVEFINDFTECRMSDGTIKKLNQNQSDQARYNQINPKAIK